MKRPHILLFVPIEDFACLAKFRGINEHMISVVVPKFAGTILERISPPISPLWSHTPELQISNVPRRYWIRVDLLYQSGKSERKQV